MACDHTNQPEWHSRKDRHRLDVRPQHGGEDGINRDHGHDEAAKQAAERLINTLPVAAQVIDQIVEVTDYVIQKAPYDASIMELVTTPAPSGIGGTVTPTQIATTFCDMERYTSEASSELDVIRYGIFTFLFPLSLRDTVNTSHELLVDGIYYEIKEVSPLLEALEIRALKREDG